MAPRKPLAEILKHDREYTRKIGDTGEQRPDAFSAVAKDLKERLDTAHSQDESPAASAEAAPVPQRPPCRRPLRRNARRDRRRSRSRRPKRAGQAAPLST